MAQNSTIEWTDHTFNPWIGCSKVSHGCKHCYAETLMDTRYGRVQWGPNGTRVRTAPANWKQPLRWNHAALLAHNEWERNALLNPNLSAPHRPRVFCASLADIFEDRPELVQWRADLFALIDATPNLDWLILTKRPINIRLMVPEPEAETRHSNQLNGHHGSYRHNLWLGTSVENQAAATGRIPYLLDAAYLCRYTFLSCEPLLGALDVQSQLGNLVGECGCSNCEEGHPCKGYYSPGIHWVICGGESGPKARPMHPDWARSLRDQCAQAQVPYFFKQWGEWVPASIEHGTVGHVMPDNNPKYTWIGWDGTTKAPSAHGLQEPIMAIARVGKHAAKRTLDGRMHNEFPTSSNATPSSVSTLPTDH
jgi:protein gp37